MSDIQFDSARDAGPESDSADVAFQNEFMLRMLEDAAGAGLRPLEEYVQCFRGREDLIRREYVRIVGADAQGPAAAPGESMDYQVGRWRVLRRIGRGGQGSVFQAVDSALGTRVALKILPPSSAVDAGCLRRIEREARVLTQLHHPGIVRVLEFGEHAGLPFVASELVEGESLARRIECGATRGAAALHATLRTFAALARALEVAHDAGVVHRDVKPSNVIVRPDGAPVLVDFGLALDESGDSSRWTRSGDVLGTLAYIAPELLTGGSREANRRSDVYALGVTLYEALTGTLPFRAGSRVELMRSVLEDPPRDPRAVAPELATDLVLVLHTALARSPDRRYHHALDFAVDLELVLSGAPVRARRPTTWQRVRAWVARERATSIALAALCVVLGAAGLLGLASSAVERRSLRQTELIADTRRLAALERERLAGWPELPDAVPAMDVWLREADALIARRPLHRANHNARASVLGGRVMTTAELSHLARFVADLEAYAPKVEVVRASRERAATLAARSVEAYAEAWAAALAEVRASAAYGGLELQPVVGLVPLGADPDTGLHEFAHLASGTPPVRDPAHARITPTADGAIVLVLLPGGRFTQGADLPGAGRPHGAANVDPFATHTVEHPAHDVHLAPFLLSKYELTQGQWLRLTGHNPSRWQPNDAAGPFQVDLTHPVENVSWEACSRVLERTGLTLPTEAQWEYAARGGTTTVWWTGDSPESLVGAANLLDRATIDAGWASAPVNAWPLVDDPFAIHAPVGSMRANGFGLFDVHGNVWEWCRDICGAYDDTARMGDSITGAGLRSMRGGSYGDTGWSARSAHRTACTQPTFSRGVRPSLEPMR